jgi:5-methylcytosine-specific restriction protein B
MNTADRSVEALDSALRRRFSFVEMPPKTDLPELQREIAGIKLSELLETINRRIEKLLDKDHLIGHSYFLNISNLGDLQNTFYRNIIPLLQEYFFGDFGKIGLVLGSGFVEVDNKKSDFADFRDYEDFAELDDRRIYRIKKEIELAEEGFKSALGLLLNKQI